MSGLAASFRVIAQGKEGPTSRIAVMGDKDGETIEVRIGGDVAYSFRVPPGYTWDGTIGGDGVLIETPATAEVLIPHGVAPVEANGGVATTD